MNHQGRCGSKTAIFAVLLALVSSGSWLGAVECWSSQTNTATASAVNARAPMASSAVSSSSVQSSTSRRSLLTTIAGGLLVGEAALVGTPTLASAADDEASYLYTRQQTVLNKKELHYQIAIPSTMKEGSKPVKTHLDEINFVSDAVKRYQYGITVDPVRISSLKEFGTPEEVAARVVTAEVNRDGIFEVTLLEDPYIAQSSEDGVDAYILKYLSVGKRGRKVYTNKIVVSPNQLLYVLTAQCKEDDFPEQQKEIKSTVESFRTF